MLLYTEDHEESLINLAVRDNDATDKVVTDDRQGGIRWWPDLLKSYSQDRQVNQCPSMRPQHGFGIGLNYHELSLWLPDPGKEIKVTTVRQPVQTLHLADASVIENPSEPDADAWVTTTDPSKQHTLFRTVFFELQTMAPTTVFPQGLSIATVAGLHCSLSMVMPTLGAPPNWAGICLEVTSRPCGIESEPLGLQRLLRWKPPSTLITSPVLKGSRSWAIAMMALPISEGSPHLGMGVRPSAMSLSYLAFTGAVMSEAMMPGHIS